MRDTIKNRQVQRFGVDRETLQHCAEDSFQHFGSLFLVKFAQLWQHGHQTLAVRSNVPKANELNIQQVQDEQARIGISPTAPQIRPDPMRQNLCERSLCILSNDGT